MRPPDDNSDRPSTEELPARRWRRRLVFTLPGEDAAGTNWSAPAPQHEPDPVFTARYDNGASRKRGGDFPAFLAEVPAAPGGKRQRTSEEESGSVHEKCVMCTFLGKVTMCYDWLFYCLLAWLFLQWFF